MTRMIFSSSSSPASLTVLPWLAKSRDGAHSVLWHSMDVGAVAQHLIERKGYLRSLPAGARTAVCLLISLHDIGKISECFRRQISPGEARAVGHVRHDVLTQIHLVAARACLAHQLDVADPTVLDIFCAAVAGHHGAPVNSGNLSASARERLIGSDAWQSGRALIEEVFRHFPNASLAGVERQTARSLSFAVSGLATHADWIASDTAAFPPCGSTGCQEAYRLQARDAARRAVHAVGFRPAGYLPYQGVSAFTGKSSLRPLQQQVDRIASLPALPDLTIIEDQTGAGKTEAALALAHAFISSGRATGLYFALPTMATANALHGRAERAATFILQDPQVGLAHAQASKWLSDRPSGGQTEVGGVPPGMPEWMASETRRSLLADIGIGTIDQAMMSVLRTRFHALRHHALRDKVLVIDEAHEADSYMEAIIARLLEFRGRQSLPTVLMSATLPLALRQLYAEAYRRGQTSAAPPADVRPRLGARPQQPATLSMPETAYPCITTLTGPVIEQVPVAPAMPRSLRFDLIDGPGACLEQLARARKIGASAVWIRNSVDEAIAAWEVLKSRGTPARILHSRFTASDRRVIERGLLADFGPDRPAHDPEMPGEIVIATQVIEAGLDVDFDVMISDLAPMSSLVQRHGRNRRHPHRSRAAGLPETPTLFVNAPDRGSLHSGTSNPKWLEAHLGRGRHIYRDDVMWQSLSIMVASPEISLPADTRRIIEASLSRDGLPAWILDLAQQFDEEAHANRFRGGQILIDPPSAGYSEQSYGDLLPEASVTTRLSRPQLTLALLLPDADGSLPPDLTDLDDVLVHIDARRLPVRSARIGDLRQQAADSRGLAIPEGILPIELAPTAEPGSWKGEVCGRVLTYRNDRGLTID